MGAQWLSGRVLDSRPKGRGFKSHRRHCVVSLSKNINPSLVLVQPRKTRPFITEILLMGRKESNQTNKQTKHWSIIKKNLGKSPSVYESVGVHPHTVIHGKEQEQVSDHLSSGSLELERLALTFGLLANANLVAAI